MTETEVLDKIWQYFLNQKENYKQKDYEDFFHFWFDTTELIRFTKEEVGHIEECYFDYSPYAGEKGKIIFFVEEGNNNVSENEVDKKYKKMLVEIGLLAKK